MPSILLLTADALPRDDADTPLVQGALVERGAAATITPWTKVAPGSARSDLIVIRSTWDYWDHSQDFLAFVAGLSAPLHNPAGVVGWNVHKRYLLALAAAGAPIIPTVLLLQGATVVDLPGFPEAAEIIVKPAISAGAFGVGRFPAGSATAIDHARTLLTDGDLLVQPFLPAVSDGERSLIFIGGRYSHAVQKRPRAGDYRVQERFGGRTEPYQPVGGDRTAAEGTLSALADAVPGTAELLYARVDLVGPVQAPMVMELELIEPDLFLRLAPGSVERFADAILERT